MTIEQIINNEYLFKQLKQISKHYYKSKGVYNLNIEYEDFEQDCILQLTRKIKYFDSDVSKITSFMYMIVNNFCCTLIKKTLRVGSNKFGENKFEFQSNMIRLNEKNSEGDELEGGFQGSNDSEMVSNSSVSHFINNGSFTDIQKKIIILLSDGYNQTEISKLLQVSINTIQYHMKQLRKNKIFQDCM